MTGTDCRRLERSGQGRRTRQGADRSRRRHRLRRRRRDRPGRVEGGRGRRQARHRRRFRPGQPVPRQGADLDAEARRRRHLRNCSRPPRTAPEGRRQGVRPQGSGVGYARTNGTSRSSPTTPRRRPRPPRPTSSPARSRCTTSWRTTSARCDAAVLARAAVSPLRGSAAWREGRGSYGPAVRACADRSRRAG